MEVQEHLETLGDCLGLIDPPRAMTGDVELLERDDVWLACGDNLGDALG